MHACLHLCLGMYMCELRCLQSLEVIDRFSGPVIADTCIAQIGVGTWTLFLCKSSTHS